MNPRSKINGETPEFVETQHFFLDLPALADALGEWLDEREASGHLAARTSSSSPRTSSRTSAPRAMTRDIDWGIPVPLDGWREQPTKRLYVWFDAVIGYLSASIEWARRSGRAPTAGATGGTTPRPCPTTSWARTTSPSTARSGPPSCWRTTARASGAGARAVRRAQPADRGGLERVHDDGEQAVLHQPRPRDPGGRHAGPLPAGRAALLHLRRRPGDLRLRLHLGGVRAAHQLRAGRGLGQPGQPDRDDDRQELRRDPARRHAGARRRGRARRGAPPASRRSAT